MECSPTEDDLKLALKAKAKAIAAQFEEEIITRSKQCDATLWKNPLTGSMVTFTNKEKGKGAEAILYCRRGRPGQLLINCRSKLSDDNRGIMIGSGLGSSTQIEWDPQEGKIQRILCCNRSRPYDHQYEINYRGMDNRVLFCDGMAFQRRDFDAVFFCFDTWRYAAAKKRKKHIADLQKSLTQLNLSHTSESTQKDVPSHTSSASMAE
jgi:hypothetical protein